MSSRLGIAGIVLLAAFGLAACGGGGSSGTADPPPPAPTAAQQIETLQSQINALRAQLGLDPIDIDELTGSVAELTKQVAALQMQIDDAAATAAAAAKLYAGISAAGGAGDATRTAAYDTTDNSLIAVTIGAAAAVNLSEDEDATVVAHHGWQGQMFTAEPAGDAGTYEAVVYSHVGDPTVTEGAAFNTAYTLDGTTGETADVITLTGHATSRVASPSFDQSAGEKTFELGENAQRIVLAGSYQGVAGTYYCAPTDRAVGCTSTVADMGFTLAGGTWTFKPTNPAQKLMDTSVPDAIYASYGWWLHKSEDGTAYTASAFHAYRGTDAGTVGIDTLRGTAKYTGGAAGKYALRGDTGDTNDAGHFTADVTLEATFAAEHTISGTVRNFRDGEGESKDWSVSLSASTISDTGGIAGDPETSGNTDAQMTTWTIGETAGNAAGSWSGDLREQGDDGVPTIATGTFYSEFGDQGRMVGAFGANRQQ